MELSRKETLNLLEEVKENDTLVRILLPQVRRNAERYGLALPLDSTEVRKLSYYVEQKFIERGLMDPV